MRVTLARLTTFSPHLKELRIHLCPDGQASSGVKEYVQRFYPALKKSNPQLPILVRECSGVQPRIWARYAKGKEVSISVTDRSVADIEKQVAALAK